MFAIQVREENIVLGAMVACPACGSETRLKGGGEEWPIQLRCSDCSADLELSRA